MQRLSATWPTELPGWGIAAWTGGLNSGCLVCSAARENMEIPRGTVNLALAACASASRWVVGWDDESRSRPLCRLPVPRRDYQPRRLAVSMDGPRKARARFSDQTINRVRLSIRPVMQRALLASMRSADRRPIILAGICGPIEPTGLADPGPTGCHHTFVRPRTAEK